MQVHLRVFILFLFLTQSFTNIATETPKRTRSDQEQLSENNDDQSEDSSATAEEEDEDREYVTETNRALGKIYLEQGKVEEGEQLLIKAVEKGDEEAMAKLNEDDKVEERFRVLNDEGYVPV